MSEPNITPLSAEETELAKRLWSVLIAENQKLRSFAHSVLDKPEDRLYHAEDRTWWRREGLTLKAADPPPEIHGLQIALAQAISRGCTCDHLYGATCNIHKLGTEAGIEEAVAHLKALEEAARTMKQYLLKLEDPRSDPLLCKSRQVFHAPLHAKLDAALKGVPNV